MQGDAEFLVKTRGGFYLGSFCIIKVFCPWWYRTCPRIVFRFFSFFIYTYILHFYWHLFFTFINILILLLHIKNTAIYRLSEESRGKMSKEWFVIPTLCKTLQKIPCIWLSAPTLENVLVLVFLFLLHSMGAVIGGGFMQHSTYSEQSFRCLFAKKNLHYGQNNVLHTVGIKLQNVYLFCESLHFLHFIHILTSQFSWILSAFPRQTEIALSVRPLWPLSDTFGQVWPFFGIIGLFCPCLAIFGCFLPLLALSAGRKWSKRAKKLPKAKKKWQILVKLHQKKVQNSQ